MSTVGNDGCSKIKLGVEQSNHNIQSYGISIDIGCIKNISLQDQASELRDLNVDVYEQSKFEEGIVQQVDSALESAENNFNKDSLRKDICSLKNEIKIVNDEIDKINTLFYKAKEGDANSTKRISFSLLQKKATKEKYIKKLHFRLSDLQKQLVRLENGESSSLDSSKIQSAVGSVELGEITPFDALKAKNADVYKENTKTSKEDNDEVYGLSDFDRLKNLKGFYKDISFNNISFQKKKPKRKSSDDEYFPEQNNEDTDILTDDEIYKKKFLDKKKICRKRGKVVKKFIRSKIKDDGDFNLFRERLRKLKMKDRFKSACKAGEVMEEYNSSDYSEDGGSDGDDVNIEDCFVLPKKIWSKLYKYQKVGVKWLWQLHSQEVGGIIGDEMGLGKTIQVIVFLIGLAYSKKGNNLNNRKVGLEAVLIVCPTTVLHQWVCEFQKWWPHFRVAILHDSGTFVGNQLTLIRAINKHPGVLVTTYGGVRKHKQELYKHKWQYVILDEGHQIRNPDAHITLACKQFDTCHRLILTGTPMQNCLKELWSLFDFVYPGRLGTLPVFMTEFSIPITMGGYANASTVQVQTAYKCSCVLKDTITPYMIRRMKKDVQSAIELPSKNEQVLFCKLSEEQRTAYKDYINSRDVASILSGEMKVFPGLIKLRKICNHPDLVTGISDKIQSTSLTDENCYGFWKRAGKMIVVENLLRMWKEQGHRALLFSQSKQLLDIMESFVIVAGHNYLRMDGTTNIKSRWNIVEKFNKDSSYFVFLLTTRVGGLGLNLTGANRIIIYDPDWNPSTDSQARERAWRIGQNKDVTIYRLLTTGTIEEKIYHRQIFKQFLTNRVLSNPFQRRFFKSNDLYELFALGDVGPQQTTETGALFAGTGSEIRLRKRPNKKVFSKESIKMLKKPNKYEQNLDKDEIEKSNISRKRKKVSSISRSAKKINSNSDLGSTIKHNVKKENNLKKQKTVKIDGFGVNNVVRKEFIQNENLTEKCKQEKSKTDDDILLSLFKTSGIHSALKHDKIVQSDNKDYILVEKEAERVAKRAVEALRQSRRECRMNGIAVPTWTGTLQGPMKKKPRFGRMPASSTPLMTSSKNSSSTITESNSLDISSTALLARMKGRDLNQNDSINSNQQGSNMQTREEIFLKDIEKFISEHDGRSVTTEEITKYFQSQIKIGENAIFKELLKQICIFQRTLSGEGQWKLKDDYLL